MKTKQKIRHEISKNNFCCSCLIIVFLTLLIIPYKSFSENSSETNFSYQYYLVIGSIEEMKQVSGSAVLSKEVQRGTNGLLRMSVPAPLSYKMLNFKNYNLFMVSGGMTTNINVGKKVVLMFSGGYPVKPDGKYLFYAEKYSPPEEFIIKNNLQDYFILKIMENKCVPLQEGTINFSRELKKHGMTIPVQGNSEGKSASPAKQ